MSNWLHIWVGLIFANFLWELITGKKDWKRAIQWTYIQSVTLLIVWWVKPWE